MKINGKDILTKLGHKNLSNKRLLLAINRLIVDFEGNSLDSFERILELRKDADKIHNAGFYFFNLHLYRVLVQIEPVNDSITVVWPGSHEEYVLTFRNNKNTIEKWLRNRKWIR